MACSERTLLAAANCTPHSLPRTSGTHACTHRSTNTHTHTCTVCRTVPSMPSTLAPLRMRYVRSTCGTCRAPASTAHLDSHRGIVCVDPQVAVAVLQPPTPTHTGYQSVVAFGCNAMQMRGFPLHHVALRSRCNPAPPVHEAGRGTQCRWLPRGFWHALAHNCA